MAKVKDAHAASTLLNSMFGERAIGVDGDGNEISSPISPEVKAHLKAALGRDCPESAGALASNRGVILYGARSAEFAEYLRSVADAIDPPFTMTEDETNAMIEGINKDRTRFCSALAEIQSLLGTTVVGVILPEDGHNILAAARLALGICNAALKVTS